MRRSASSRAKNSMQRLAQLGRVMRWGAESQEVNARYILDHLETVLIVLPRRRIPLTRHCGTPGQDTNYRGAPRLLCRATTTRSRSTKFALTRPFKIRWNGKCATGVLNMRNCLVTLVTN